MNFILVLLFLLQHFASFSQPDKYSISTDKKGYLTLTNKATNEAKFVKCNSIDTVPVILKNTDLAYKNYLIIRKGDRTTLFNTQNDKTIFSGEMDRLGFEEIPDIRDADSILPKKMVMKLLLVKKERTAGMNLNVQTGKIIALSNSANDQFNHDRSLIISASKYSSEVIDLTGKKIIENCELLNNIKKAFVVRKDHSYFKRGKVGVIDTKGNIIVPFSYTSLHYFVENHFIAWDSLEEHCGIIRINNKVVVPFEYFPDMKFDTYHNKSYPSYLYSDFGAVVLLRSKKKGDFVLVDTTNTILIEHGRYTEIQSLNNQRSNRFFAVASPTGLKGIYDVKRKKEIFPCEYTSFGNLFSLKEQSYFIEKGIMVAEKNGRWGLLDLETGKPPIPFEYDTKDVKFLKDSVQDYFLLRKNGKMGMIDIKGRILIPFEHDEIKLSIKGYYIVKNMGLYGLLEADTYKQVLPAEYSDIKSGYHFKREEDGGRMQATPAILLEKIEGEQLKKGMYSRTGGVSWEQ